MKKTKFVSISILGTLLLLCFMDFTIAAPPSYVGIRTGETYTWKADLAADNLNTTGQLLFGDNWTYMYEYFAEYWENKTYCPFNFFQGTGMRFKLTNVSDELFSPYLSYPIPASGLYFDQYISYCNNNYTMIYNSSGLTSPMMYIFDPSYLNQSTYMYYIGYGGMPVFTPIGLDWVTLATYWNLDLLNDTYTSGNITITALSNGFKIDIAAILFESLYNETGANFTVSAFSDGEFTLTWNSKGVFNKGVFEYGGLEIATGYLVEEEGGIPGYELPILVGITIVSSLGLIYGIMKKKKLSI